MSKVSKAIAGAMGGASAAIGTALLDGTFDFPKDAMAVITAAALAFAVVFLAPANTKPDGTA